MTSLYLAGDCHSLTIVILDVCLDRQSIGVNAGRTIPLVRQKLNSKQLKLTNKIMLTLG